MHYNMKWPNVTVRVLLVPSWFFSFSHSSYICLFLYLTTFFVIMDKSRHMQQKLLLWPNSIYIKWLHGSFFFIAWVNRTNAIFITYMITVNWWKTDVCIVFTYKVGSMFHFYIREGQVIGNLPTPIPTPNPSPKGIPESRSGHLHHRGS